MVGKEVYEEYFFNASPSMLTINIGGFIAKYDGIDISSNCIYPLYQKNESDLENKVVELENFLLERELVPLYRIVYQDNYQALDKLLFNRHYEKVEHSLVLACPLQGKKDELFKFANFNENGVFFDKDIFPNDDFSIDYFETKMMNKSQMNIFNNTIMLSPLDKYGVTLLEENKVIAQAYLALQGEVVILKDICVDQRYQGLGYASKLLYSILTYSLKHGAKIVIAEVSTNNMPAMHLFESNTMFVKLYDIFYRQYLEKTKGRFVFD